MRSQILRSSALLSPLPPSQYTALSSHLSDSFAQGAYLKTPPKLDSSGAIIEPTGSVAPPNPLTDPGAMDGMMEGMKKQMVMMVPNFLIMGWVRGRFLSPSDSHITPLTDVRMYVTTDQLFLLWLHLPQAPVPAHPRLQVDASAGYRHPRHGCPLGLGALVVFPQPLRSQRSVHLCLTSYASPLLTIQILPGVFRLLLSSPQDIQQDPTSTQSLAQLSGALPPGAPPMQPDATKMFKAELENLEFAAMGFRWAGETVEQRVRMKWAL